MKKLFRCPAGGNCHVVSLLLSLKKWVVSKILLECTNLQVSICHSIDFLPISAVITSTECKSPDRRLLKFLNFIWCCKRRNIMEKYISQPRLHLAGTEASFRNCRSNRRCVIYNKAESSSGDFCELFREIWKRFNTHIPSWKPPDEITCIDGIAIQRHAQAFGQFMGNNGICV